MADEAQQFYSGTFFHAIDGQNRITIPSIWRGGKGGGARHLFIVPHHEKVLWILPPSQLAKMQEKLDEASMGDRDTWNAMRVVLGRTQQCVLDSQGRITINPDLLKHAGLEVGKEAAMVGLMTRFEIVNRQRHAEMTQNTESNLGDIMSRVKI